MGRVGEEASKQADRSGSAGVVGKLFQSELGHERGSLSEISAVARLAGEAGGGGPVSAERETL